MTAVEVHLPDAHQSDFGQRPLLARHTLHHHELFGDEALSEVLDRFPRQHLYAWTTGLDHSQPGDNRLAANRDVSGADLLRAVRAGRYWLNITRIDLVDRHYRALIDTLYEQLAAQASGFEPISSQGALLISSPRAIVYYHVDAPANILWHVRGRKRIWIYPALDERYLPREVLEDVYAGVRHEYLAYEPSFDDGAVSYELGPGDWATWPHNAPHRVTNLDTLNVSLSTEHFTAASLRRQRVYAANRFLRTRFALRRLSARETGAGAMAKTIVHRVANRLGLDPLQLKRYVAVDRVDADAPEGVMRLSGGTAAVS